MAPKRARTAAARASASSSSQSATATTKLALHGGVPHHPALAGLWRDERLTDFAVSAEGVEFKAHRVALASSSKYFLNLFESGMRDAADATHALEGIRPKALEVLLAFVYEGKCQIDEGQLTEVLEASARLGGRRSQGGVRRRDRGAARAVERAQRVAARRRLHAAGA